MKQKAALIQYCKKISDHEIVACQKHIWSCERFLRDLEHEGTENFPYRFDEEKAERIIQWSRFFKHTKGVLFGKKIEPHITHKFILANIYGWHDIETGYRRFKKSYVQLARKNAKSQLESIKATFELMVFLDGGLAEVYCAATNKEQAKIVYNEAKLMLEGCSELNGKWREAYRKIEHLKSSSILRPLSKDDKLSGDGLNPQCGIIDEYHAHATSEILDVVDSGMGARPEPLLSIVTTAGFNLNSPCYRVEYKIASEILDPENQTEIESEFALICELETNETSDAIEIDGRTIAPGELIDDINDETVWQKANPIICSYAEGKAFLREKLKEAKTAPDKMRNFLTKHMNVWVNQRDAGYLNLGKWNACGVSKADFPSTEGMTCYVGLDLSAKIDLTSVAFIFPNLVDGKYGVMSHSFIPETRLNERLKVDKMPFDVWIDQGFLTCTSGEVVNYTQVMEYCIELAEKNRWYFEAFCLDPWGSMQLSNNLIELGHEVIDIVQGIKTLSEPTKAFREEIYKGNVIHDNSPVLAWALGNAVVDMVDKNENIMLNKKRSVDRIDPAAAVLNAFVRAMIHDSTQGYNNRGMRDFNV